MSILRGLFVRKDETRGTGPSEARVALAGLLIPDGPLGVVPGVLSGLTVTGLASTWAYTVSAGHVATTRGATDGAALFALDGATDTPEVPVAPASGARWDLIWVRHRDVDQSDPDSEAALGVTSGNASGSPSKPYGDVPVGAEVLAEAEIQAGATGTLDANVIITQVARRTGVRGGIIPVTGQTQLDALEPFATAATPILADRLDTGQLVRNAGSGWAEVWSAESGGPWRSARGTVNFTGSGASVYTTSVVYPVGRFTVSPVVTLGARQGSTSGVILATFTANNASGFTAVISHRAGTVFNPSGNLLHWIAEQATPSSASG